MTTLSNRLEKNWRNIIRGELDIGSDFDYVAMEQFLQGEEMPNAPSIPSERKFSTRST
jgi:hypothetical protein